MQEEGEEARQGGGGRGGDFLFGFVCFIPLEKKSTLAVAVLANRIPEFVEWQTNISGRPIHSVSFIRALSQIVNLPEATVT